MNLIRFGRAAARPCRPDGRFGFTARGLRAYPPET
jgi:hypothetical protein